MPSTSPARSLSRRLIAWFIVVASLPLVATSVLSYWSSREVVAGLLEENLGKTARLYAAEVDDFLAEKTELLRALSGGIEADDGVLAEVVARTPTLEELLVLDANGAVIARSGGEVGWATEACRGPMAPMQHTHHGGHEVVVAVPRRGGGRLCGRVSFTLHQDMISERAQSAFGGLAYIVDRSGDVVCHAFEEDEPHIQPGEPIRGPAAEHARVGRPWHGIVEVDGEPHFAAFAPATDLPWGVWAEVPMADAAGVLRPLASRAVALGVALMVVLSGGILLLTRRLAAPIEELAGAAKRIAEGRYGEQVPVRTDDEIGLLAQRFNGMSQALAEAVRTLDARVAARTAELEAARRFSDTVLDTLEQRVIVIGPDHRVVKANRAALAAYGDGLVGCGCEVVHETAPGCACPTDAFFEGGRVEGEERVRRRPDGDVEILSVERFAVPGPGGPTALLEIERDITESKQLHAHLVHQEKMAALGTMAAGMAHEIGNPLASMSSELELLERAWDPDDARASLPVLRDQVRRMASLLRDLMDFGRRPREGTAPFDPALVVEEVVRLLRHDPRSRGVELTVERGGGPRELCSGRDRLVQVLVNLGINALDAMGGSGALVFRLSAGENDGVRIEVQDSGPGVSEEVADRVFDPFVTTKPPGEGTGLGLFVSERLVRELGGRLELVRGGPGATFVVQVPNDRRGDDEGGECRIGS